MVGGITFVLWVIALFVYWIATSDTATVRVSERQCIGGYAKDGSCIKETYGASFKFIL